MNNYSKNTNNLFNIVSYTILHKDTFNEVLELLDCNIEEVIKYYNCSLY